MPTSTQSEEKDDANTHAKSSATKPRSAPILFTDDQIDALATVFQNRAGDAKRTASITLALTIIIRVAILSIFIFFAATNLTAKIPQYQSVDTEQKEQPTSRPASSAIGSYTMSRKYEGPEPFALIVQTTGILIVRIGAVLIGIFIMQVMINFVRYNTRMYFRWSMCSALIRLSRGNHLIIKDLASTLTPSSIDFGKATESPTEKIIDGVLASVKELSKKIPNHK